jgi:peptidoglycan/LPS O-acetylase OafA/YrhL
MFIEVGMRGLEGALSVFVPSLTLPRWYTSFPLIYWFSWSMGAMIADSYLKGEPLPFRRFSPWLFFMLFIGSYFYKPIQPFGFMFGALMTAALIVRLLNRPATVFPSQGWLGAICNHLRWTGLVSYSLYLIHQPLVTRVPRWAASLSHNQHLPHLLVYGLCLLSWPFIFGIAYLFYRYVELPSIAWGKRIIKERALKRLREGAPA